jgi:mono/diheme cytochrome c family protein
VRQTLTAIVFVAALPAASLASAQAPAQVEHGQKVFTAQKCAVCHSIAGQGNKKGTLDGVGAKLSADETRQWIVNAPAMAAKTKAERKPPMKAYATLPKEELDALVAYLQSLKTP